MGHILRNLEKIEMTSRMSRRQLVKLGGAAGAWLAISGVLAACGGAASGSPAPSAASAAGSAKPAASAATSAKPAASTAGSAKPAGSAAASPAGSAAALKPQAPTSVAPVPATWDAMLAAAKAEGKVVVTGAPDTDTRQKLPAAFKQRFGIEMEYLPDATGVTARLQGERAAGQYTLDAEINGSDSVYATLYANGWLDPIKPALLLPDAVDASKWKTGGPWFRDPNGDTTLQIFSTISWGFTTNSDIVSSKDLPTADSLLDPKWKGKICAFDPGANGAGLAVGAALYVSKGPEFASKLYKDQNVTLSRDYKQLADWLAHGSYPIGIAVSANYLADYVKAGLKFDYLDFPDAPNSVGGGFGIVVVLNRAPHPNAARVFANWMASKEGMALYSETQVQAPVRNDITATWMPDRLIPKAGGKYVDTYEYKFATGTRLQARDFYTKLLR
jgi:iron(III) transport system substrate-binding protein